MDFSSLFSSNSNTNSQSNSLIQRDLDREKYEKISNTMCEKRKGIEKSLENKELEVSLREAQAFALIQIKRDMATFSISEVEYQIYLTKVKDEDLDPQLPFAS